MTSTSCRAICARSSPASGLEDVTLRRVVDGVHRVAAPHGARRRRGGRLVLLNGPLRLTRAGRLPPHDDPGAARRRASPTWRRWPVSERAFLADSLLPRDRPAVVDRICAIALQTPLDVRCAWCASRPSSTCGPPSRPARSRSGRCTQASTLLPGQPRRGDRRLGARRLGSRCSSTARTARRSRSRRRSSPSSKTSSPAGRPRLTPPSPGARCHASQSSDRALVHGSGRRARADRGVHRRRGRARAPRSSSSPS